MTLAPAARRRLRWSGALALFLGLGFGVFSLFLHRSMGGAWLTVNRLGPIRRYVQSGDPAVLGVDAGTPEAARLAKVRVEIVRRFGPDVELSTTGEKDWNTFPIWPGGRFYNGAIYLWRAEASPRAASTPTSVGTRRTDGGAYSP